MRRAVRRGVEVAVIVAGVTDVPAVRYATRWLYGWMLRKVLLCVANPQNSWASLNDLLVKHLQLFRDNEHRFILGQLQLAEFFLG